MGEDQSARFDRTGRAAFVGRAHAGGCEVVRWGWIGTRYEIMSRTAKLAPNAVRLELMRMRCDEGGRP